MALRPRINEFVFNHDGSDVNEYIEIAADPNTDLSAYRLVIIDGDGAAAGNIDNVITPGTTNAAGYYVTPYTSDALQNGTQTLLLVLGYSGNVTGDLDANNDGTLETVRWTEVVDSIAVRDTNAATDFTYLGAPTLAPQGTAAVGGASRIPDATDTDAAADFVPNNFNRAGLPASTATASSGEALNTPGAANAQGGAAPAVAPIINEFVFNHTGTDTNEYIEVKAAPGADLSSYKLVVLDGDGASSGNIDNVLSLGTANAAGYYVTPYLNNALQNGTQTLLLVQNYTGAASGDLDADDDGILDATPWTAIADSIAVSDGGAGDRTYAGAPVLLPQNGLTVGGASRIPDGIDANSPSDFLVNDFDAAGIPGFIGTPAAGEAFNTPGAANQAVPPPTVATVAIHTIQGAAQVSPYAGRSVQTSGVVTAIDRSDSIGFWMQDPNPDGDVATSEAIFVFTNSVARLPNIGDAVTVSGTVSEFNNGSGNNLTVTEITSPTITVTSSNNPLPAATIIGQGGRTPPTGTIYDDQPGNLNTGIGDFQPGSEGVDFFESLEGMRVQVNNAVVIQPTNTFAETWVLADNGAGSTLRTPRGGILLQQNDENPERILFEADQGVLTGQGSVPQASVGDSFATLTGVLDYDFGNYRIKLTSVPSLSGGGLKQEVTNLRGSADELQFAEWNVENLDPSDPKFDAIARVIGTNLRTPDILALQEIQDSNGATNNGVTDATLTAAKLIAATYAETGIVYAYADIAPANGTSGGEPGGNIRPGFLYNPGRVALTGLSTITDSDPSNGNAFAASRLPLVGTFTFNGQTVTLIDVHYSSKSGGTSSYGSVQPEVNGAEAARIAQATETKKVTDALLARDPNALIAVLGDHNEFAWNASQQILTSDGSLINMDELLPKADRYSYTFDGNSQALDHTLASQALFDASAFDTVHLDSEFPDATRISDHDPSVTNVYLPAGSATSPATTIDAAATRTIIATTAGSASGGSGADILIAAADAVLTGNAGADLFTFVAGLAGGTVTVADFTAGLDHITLQNYGATAEQTAYDARTVAGGSTTLLLPDSSKIVLAGITALDRSALI